MRQSYQNALALPPDVEFYVTWENDNQVDQNKCDNFVANLNRPGWYTHDSSWRRDTRLYMLEKYQPFTVTWIDGKPNRTWTCECCGNKVLYEGVHLGHKNNWREELKNAGVLDTSEAKAAYNNLTNLRIECSTCNQSHDFE